VVRSQQLRSAAISDTGYARTVNEDIVHNDDERGIYAVIDGMGGQAAGEEAARIALEQVRGRLERPVGNIEERVREAIALANNSIVDAAQRNDAWRGMGCVLTIGVLDSGTLTVGHVGDSRLYKFGVPNGSGKLRLEKVTHDHSPVGEMEEAGELSEEEAMRHPRRNEVYRDVGLQPHTPRDENFIEVLQVPAEPESAFLFCSDGLSDVLRSDEIRRIVEENAGDVSLVARRLIEAANENSKDNVSVVYAEGTSFAASLGRVSAEPAGPHVEVLAAEPASEDTEKLPTFRFAKPPEPEEPAAKSHTAAVIVLSILLAAAAGAAGWLWIQQQNAPKRLVVEPGPGAIAAAMDRARAGDLVVVRGGEYPERLHLKSAVWLVGESSEKPVIKGDGSDGPVAVADGVQQARLENLAFSGEKLPAGAAGIAVRDSGVLLENIELSRFSGPALTIEGKSHAVLENSHIHSNTGTAIVVRDGAFARITHNRFSGPGSVAPPVLIDVLSPRGADIIDNLFLGAKPDSIRGEPRGRYPENYFVTDPERRSPAPGDVRR
jgi:serine/threonine protein phosphatase PrpC